jgi:hypothetical protein
MTLIERLRKQLEEVGATLDCDEDTQSFSCDAPSGYEWQANGCTCIVAQFENVVGQRWLREAIYEDAMPRLTMGLTKVTDPTTIAYYRHMMDDDTWGAAEDAPDFIPFPKQSD